MCLSSPHALLKGTGGSREFPLLILTPVLTNAPKLHPTPRGLSFVTEDPLLPV